MNKTERVSLEQHFPLGATLNRGWFKGLNEDEIKRLIDVSELHTYSADQTVYIPGERQENLFCIIDGLIRVSLVSDEGDYFPLIIWEAGHWFGEGALFEDSVMPVQTMAEVETKLLVIPISKIDNTLDNSVIFYKNILHDMIGRTQLLYRLVDMLLFKTLKERVAARILHLLNLFGTPSDNGMVLTLEFSQSDFARMSGGSRQRVNKIFGSWYSSGIMTKQDKSYVIHDIQALQAEIDN